MFKPLMLSTLLFAAPVVVAHAQIPEPPRGVAGAVVSFTEAEVTLKRDDGSIVVVPMTPKWTVSKPRKSTVAELKAGDFIGSRNVNIDDGSGRAEEVRIFEPGYRPEEGTHLVAMPATSMTHGDIKSVATTPAGKELALTYAGGTRRLLVPAQTEITVSDPLPRDVLKPGVKVSSVTRRGPDNVYRASRMVLAQ